jgi:hypothetical protein
MLSDVIEHFGLRNNLRQVDFFETEHHRQRLKDLNAAIYEGGIVAVPGSNTSCAGRLGKRPGREPPSLSWRAFKASNAAISPGYSNNVRRPWIRRTF